MSKKIAEQWAENYLNSEEGKLEKEKICQEFIDYLLFGKPTRYLNEPLIDEMSDFVKFEELSVEQIIERFGDLLSEKDIENIRK